LTAVIRLLRDGQKRLIRKLSVEMATQSSGQASVDSTASQEIGTAVATIGRSDADSRRFFSDNSLDKMGRSNPDHTSRYAFSKSSQGVIPKAHQLFQKKRRPIFR